MKRRRQTRFLIAALASLLACAAVQARETNTVAPEAATSQAGLPSSSERQSLQQDVEFLRGLKFRHEVPMKSVSAGEMSTAMVKDFEKQYPGNKLADYQELLIRTGLVPPGTDLAAAVSIFAEDEVAGAYDPETKQMYIPRQPQAAPKPNPSPNPAKKAAEQLPDFAENIILIHEYTHALEDQYWDLQDLAGAKKNHLPDNSDRDLADDCVLEGSATRIMTEALATSLAQNDGDGRLDAFPLMWQFLHSGAVELGLRYAYLSLWKGDNAKVPGVPDAVAQSEVMPYSFGYDFCTETMKNWGIGGLDYIHSHPPADTRQVIHPWKYWEGDLPAAVELPETLPGGWTRQSDDTFGEAGVIVLFGNNLHDMLRGQGVARGWDGDHVALYKNAAGRWLTVWATSWASDYGASAFVTACLDMREKMFQADVAQSSWACADGRHGYISRTGKRVIVAESDAAASDYFPSSATLNTAVHFTEPSENAASENNTLLAYNPVFSSWHHGSYSLDTSLCGMLWRHEHNPVGRADSLFLGLADSHRSESFHHWNLAWSLLVNHETDDRRALSQTSLLPLGVLWRHFSSPVLRKPDDRLQHDSCLWGVLGSRTSAGASLQLHVLLGGLLFDEHSTSNATGTYILGTGVRHEIIFGKRLTTVRLLGIPVYHHTEKKTLKSNRPVMTENASAGVRPSPGAASHE